MQVALRRSVLAAPVSIDCLMLPDAAAGGGGLTGLNLLVTLPDPSSLILALSRSGHYLNFCQSAFCKKKKIINMSEVRINDPTPATPS